MIEVAERPRIRVAGRRSESHPLAFVRRLDWILLGTALALVAYGLWVVAGITRFDVPGDENYFVVRQAIAAGSAWSGSWSPRSCRSTSCAETGGSSTARRSR